MQAALAALATLGVTVTLDGDCGRTELAATSPAPYNSATKCTKLKNIDNLESICELQDKGTPILRAVEFGAESLLVAAPRRAPKAARVGWAPEVARVGRAQAQHGKDADAARVRRSQRSWKKKQAASQRGMFAVKSSGSEPPAGSAAAARAPRLAKYGQQKDRRLREARMARQRRPLAL
jgi:hypothetical protein